MNKRRLQTKKRGKKMKKVRSKITVVGLSFVIFFSSLVIFQSSFAEDFDLTDTDSWEISASNQLEYSLDNKNHQDIFHDWFDFNWTYSLYNVGLRYEAHQPDDWGKTSQELSYRYFQLSP
jgi:hypothetical protein